MSNLTRAIEAFAAILPRPGFLAGSLPRVGGRATVPGVFAGNVVRSRRRHHGSRKDHAVVALG
jgi:hypothetical protein